MEFLVTFFTRISLPPRFRSAEKRSIKPRFMYVEWTASRDITQYVTHNNTERK